MRGGLDAEDGPGAVHGRLPLVLGGHLLGPQLQVRGQAPRDGLLRGGLAVAVPGALLVDAPHADDGVQQDRVEALGDLVVTQQVAQFAHGDGVCGVVARLGQGACEVLGPGAQVVAGEDVVGLAGASEPQAIGDAAHGHVVALEGDAVLGVPGGTDGVLDEGRGVLGGDDLAAGLEARVLGVGVVPGRLEDLADGAVDGGTAGRLRLVGGLQAPQHQG